MYASSNPIPSAPPAYESIVPNSCAVVEAFEIMMVGDDGLLKRTTVPAGFRYSYIQPSSSDSHEQALLYDSLIPSADCEEVGKKMVREEHTAVLNANEKALRYQAAMQYRVEQNNIRRFDNSCIAFQDSKHEANSTPILSDRRIIIPTSYVSSNEYDPSKSDLSSRPAGGYEPASYECAEYAVREYKSIYE
jgi:hypothetical protein